MKNNNVQVCLFGSGSEPGQNQILANVLTREENRSVLEWLQMSSAEQDSVCARGLSELLA